MQKKGIRTALSALFMLASSLGKLHGAAAQFPVLGDDVTPSLAQFRILVSPDFQAMLTGYPNYNAASHMLTSPMLYDPSTLIGRSGPLPDGSANDAGGVPVGSAGTIIGEGLLMVQPGGLGPAKTREIHTEIRSLKLTDFAGSVAAVRAGTNAPGRPASAGEVESWSGASLNPALDFPAKSFFDVFVQVDLPGGGGFPGATNLYNDLPLLVQNTNVTSFPPQVIYVHGMSTAVPIKFSNNNPPVWTNGQIFGLLLLAGHDVVRTNDAPTQAAFQAAMNALPNVPVEPAYSNWGPGLTIASNSMIFTNRGDDITTSLGTFRLAVNPTFQPFMSGYPGWDSTTKRLTSPLLSDASTTIGRSSPVTNGSAAELTGVPVGSAGTIVASSNLTLLPPLFEGPAGTREVHTEIRSLNLAGMGAAVRAGTAAGASQHSVGEVESLSGNSGDPYWDFPAKSFFDVFVAVDVPAAGSFPGATLSNAVPLIVQNNNLMAFPPKVIYVHGNSTAVPVLFTTNVPAIGANAGDTFGILLLAGHGVGFNQNNSNDVALFQQSISQQPEQPVDPQYVSWAPNLKTNAPTYPPIVLTCSSNITVTATSGSSGAYVYFNSSATGGCSPPIIGYNPPSGAYFPIGTTSVSCSATDTCGGSAYCGFLVTVNPPASPPVINCPSNLVVTTSNLNGAIVNFTVGVTGGCAPVSISTSPYNSGDTFPLGTAYEYAYVYDCNGYEGYCSFTVTVTNTNSTPLVVTCPSNLTVMASSSSGAVVNFTVGTSGGCPPIYVSTSPYSSGSMFPIGTTTENVYVYDSCVGSYVYYCSFNVTVNLPAGASVNEYFSPQPLLPPLNSVYISPAQWHALYANGIVIRDVRHRFFTQNYPLPALGNTTTETFSSEVDYQLSTDGGVTFNPASGTANVSVQVTHGLDNNGVSFFNTEMTQLNLNGTGFQLRESPTLQSTGQTTVRPVAGGYMISSFFDIFTEVSLDGGNTWMPAQAPGHMEMRPDPKQVNPSREPTPLLPPPNDHYVSPAQWHALYAQGIVIKNVSHRLFTGSLPPPPPGVTNLHSFNSTLNLQYSADGGTTFQFARVGAPVQVAVANASSSGGNPLYDTEMTSLNVTLPGGIMLRESPTEPSRGQTEIDAQADGSYRINSFFDIFTELSLDGGATWSPATNGPVRMQLTQQAPEVVTPNGNLPLNNTPYVSPSQWHALYANDIILTNLSHSKFTQTQPPPPPGGNQTENFGSEVDGMISQNGGGSFQPFSAPANVVVQVNSRSDLDTGNTRYFDTEMLSLNLSGGNLPGGVMVRESPTKQSLGRTSVRTDSTGGYHISSFFDIFTEVSLDGGQTWSPSVTGPGTMSPGTNNPASAISINCPSNITVTATSSTGATVFYTVTASGGCSPPPSVTANPPSGSTFPIGTTTVFASASDTCGNSSQCSFSVTVVAPPINLNCPSNITVTATSSGGEIVFFTVSATGGCNPPPFVSASPPSGSTFPVGTTTVYAYASDSCGGYTNCSFTVTVTPPVYPPIVLACPSNITVTATGSGGAVVYYAVTASGGCNPPPYVYAYPPSGSTFPVGTTTVNTTASDSCGDYTNCSFTVTVMASNCVMSIYCPSNIVVTSTVPTTVYFNVSASDSCGGIPSIISSPPSGSTFPIGTTPVFSTASDANGSNSCSFTVTVVKPVSPPILLICSSNLTVNATSSGGATVFFSVTASGGCSPPPMLVANPPSGSTFPVGTTTVLVTASDTCGNSTNCSFQVTVVRPPISLSCSSNLTVTATSSSGAIVFFTVTASGGCSPPPMLVANPPSGSTFPVGTTTVTVTASDNCGGSTNCSFLVTVVKPPISLNCSSNITVTATSSNGATVFFNVTATGGCSPPPMIVANPPSGSTFPVGTTTVSVTASDTCGTFTNCSFTVHVNPPVYPPIVLNCSSNLTVNATSSGGATVFFSVTASGGCSPPPMLVANPPSGSTFPVGTTTVLVTASDTCGNSTNCSFQVTVVRPPISLNCSSNLTVTATSSSGATVFFTVTASGGCSPPPTIMATPPSGSTFPVGTTTVTVTASDNCGGSTNCSFQVTVIKPPISLNCSSNITVTATSSNGMVVFFTLSATGGCSPPPFVMATPPSGSTFPVGTTTVTATASDTCGDSTNCSFTVTVNPQLPVVNEYFSTIAMLPPPASMYISPAQWHVLYANGIIIRDVRHHFFTLNYPLPALGASLNEVFGSQLDFNLSTDNGATFHPATGNASVTVKVTHSQDANDLSYFDTEMLQLDVTVLGNNLMLRESPTLQSTGQTTVRPVTGGYMISSFFDIFTEISTDGGISWLPAQAPGHVEMRPDPATAPVAGEPTPLLPAPNDAYVSPAQWHALYAQGIVIRNISHKLFTGSLLPPTTGATNAHSFNSILDLDISTDGGNTFQSVRANAPVQVNVANASASTDNPLYDTEMTSLNLTGLPNGIMVRESPTLPSRGMTQISAQSDGTFKVNSFFDIFTELSLDGGATWSPATNGAIRMQLTQRAPEVATANGLLPLTNRPYVSPAQWHAAYANGVYITNVTHSGFTANYPPPAPGGTNTESFNSTVTGQISTDGGHTFVPFTASAPVTVNVASHSSLDNNNTRFFDTEMTSMSLSGGNLPGGLMVRESPTKQSVGRTSVRNDGTGYHISSFFDVFMELSLDGGNTWTAASTQPATMAASTNAPAPSQSSNLQVTKTANTNSVSVGGPVTFLITVTNLGPNTSTNVTISDVLPPGLTYVGSGSTCGALYNPSTGIMTIPTLAAGTSCALSLTAMATNVGTFTNTVTLTSATPPNTNVSNTASATVTATVSLPPADLVVTKAVSTNSVGPFTNSVMAQPGQAIYFQIGIQNAGPANPTNIVINDLLPPGLAYVASTSYQYNANTGVWTIGTLVGNGTYFMYLTCQATNVGTFTNTATVPVPNGVTDPILSNNTASAAVTVTLPQADLAVTKAVNRSWQNTNAQVQFTVTVQNLGPNTASNALVQDLLPPGLTLVSSNIPAGTTYNPGTGAWSIPSLTNGGSVILYLNVTAPNPASFTNVAYLASSGSVDPNPLNNTNRASVTFLAGQAADLAVLLVPVTNAAPVGGSILFQLTVTNLGPNSPTNVTAKLTWPAGMMISGVFGPFDGSSTFNTNTGILNVSGALVPTTAVEVNILFTLTNAGVFNVSFATASASLPDPNTNNNSASVTVTGLVSYAISGGIRSCSGSALTNITVNLAASTLNTSTNTGTNGSFTFNALLPGTYTITPANSNYFYSPSNMVVTITNANVTLTNFIAAPRFITGTVLQGGTNGQPVSGVMVSLGGALSLTNKTDTNGVYIFTNLNAGAYTVTPQTNGFLGMRFSPTNANLTLGSITNCTSTANFITTNLIVVLRALEVVQVVQDWSNSVVLVANKTTLVRAHLQLYGTNTTPILVEGAKLYAQNGGSSTSWPPDNGRITVSTNNCAVPPIRGDITKSLNFTVRGPYNTGADLYRFIWTNGVVLNAEPADVAGDVASNGQVRVTFNPVPPLGVRFIRIALTNSTVTNITATATNIMSVTNQPSLADIEEQKTRLIAIYPITQITNLTPGYYFWTRSRGAPVGNAAVAFTNESRLLREINSARLTSSDTNGSATNRIWYGLLPSGVRVRGLGYTPGGASEGVVSAVAENYQRNLAAHEIGHNLGRQHSVHSMFGQGTCPSNNITGRCNECARAAVAPDFPLVNIPPFGLMPALGPITDDNQSTWGYDTYLNRVITPYLYFDLMSYCAGYTNTSQWPWNSKNTYTNIYNRITSRFGPLPPPLQQGPPIPGPDQPPGGLPTAYLLVRGTIDDDSGLTTFEPCYPIAGPLPSTPGPFTLVLLDTNAVPLYSLPFTPDETDQEFDGVPTTTTFDVSVPIIPGAAAIEIYSNGIPSGELVADAYPPTVQLLHPNGGESYGDTDIPVSWTGSDPDGSPLNYLVQFSRDGGSSWDTLAIDLDQTNLDIPPGSLPATTNGLLRVIASDGLNFYVAQSAGPFTITNHVPTILILQPAPGALFYGDQTVVLQASAFGMDDGTLDGTNVVWTSSLDGFLGNGAELPLLSMNLHEGVHTITTTAIANSGLTNSASEQISVLRLAPPQLSIQLTNSNQILLSWPVIYTNYVLESTTSLLPMNWTTVTNAPVGTNLLQTVNLNLSTTNRFFRLRMP